MIFLTVGTVYPFDRLVSTIDELVGKNVITEEVFAQIGDNGYQPKNFAATSALDRGKFDDYFSRADAIISHAGMGNIIMATRLQKPLLVMPRMKRFREHVNDHQVTTARRFEKLECVLAAYVPDELEPKIGVLKTFVPKKREANKQAVILRINDYLRQLTLPAAEPPRN